MAFSSATPLPYSASIILSKIRDIFENQSTDENGEVILTLTRIPTSINNIQIQCLTAGFVATATDLTDNNLTLAVRYMKYLKTTAVDGTGNLTNLPSGITERTTKFNTDNGGGTSTYAINGGSNSASNSHAHGISGIYSHGHDKITTELTDMPLAVSETGLNFSVMYE